MQVANTRHDGAGGKSARSRRGPQAKMRARERIAAERAARIANRYILAGAQYNPQVLAGLSAAQIASQLGNPSSPVARAVDGSAQVIVAAIDQIRHDKTARS